MKYHIKTIRHGSDAYVDMLALRNAVLRDPINYPRLKAENLLYESDVLLLGGYSENNILCACCVVLPEDEGIYRLRQMAVRNDLHGQGLGRKLLEYAEQKVVEKGGQELIMSARHYAVGFYAKSGYTKEGAPFEEVGMEHWRMRKNLL